jgi:hypothetical protein
MVAVEPLLLFRSVESLSKSRTGTYSAPRARIKAIDTLVHGFIARSFTTNIGRIAKVQSATAEMAE